MAVMRAMVLDRIRGPLAVREVPDPVPPDGGVVVRVLATGLCRSDWHAWAGHDEIACRTCRGTNWRASSSRRVRGVALGGR